VFSAAGRPTEPPGVRRTKRAASRATSSRPVADGQPSITLKWFAILGGLAVSYIASVAMGVVLARTGLAGNLTLFPFVQFLALFAGGYVAGRWAGVSGFMNGVAVAVAFIVVWAVQNAVQEARLVDEFGPLALPRMNIPGILLGDVLNLSAAAFGGWLADRKRG
jgi:hypothetical protein